MQRKARKASGTAQRPPETRKNAGNLSPNGVVNGWFMIGKGKTLKDCGRLTGALLAALSIASCAATQGIVAPQQLALAQPASRPMPAVPAVPPASAVTPTPEAKPQARPASAWHTNQKALQIIEEAEGLRLRAYRLAGQWLIGYGHATKDQNAEAVADMTISEDRARELLKSDVRVCEDAVRRVLTVSVTQNQFSALVAFCYNVGQTTLANSSIVRNLNDGDEESAADAFLLYDCARIDNEKRPVAPLAERRIRERYLFLAS